MKINDAAAGADGYPTDAYFTAVQDALTARGVALLDAWRDEPWDYTIQLGPARGYAKIFVGWRADEERPPEPGERYSPAVGWHWVPYTDAGQALGDRAEPLGVDVLDEPEQVADAVARLVLGDGTGQDGDRHA